MFDLFNLCAGSIITNILCLNFCSSSVVCQFPKVKFLCRSEMREPAKVEQAYQNAEFLQTITFPCIFICFKFSSCFCEIYICSPKYCHLIDHIFNYSVSALINFSKNKEMSIYDRLLKNQIRHNTCKIFPSILKMCKGINMLPLEMV